MSDATRSVPSTRAPEADELAELRAEVRQLRAAVDTLDLEAEATEEAPESALAAMLPADTETAA